MQPGAVLLPRWGVVGQFGEVATQVGQHRNSATTSSLTHLSSELSTYSIRIRVEDSYLVASARNIAVGSDISIFTVCGSAAVVLERNILVLPPQGAM